MNWLTEKKAGLPIWAWGLIISAVILLGLYYLRSKTPKIAGSPPLTGGGSADLGGGNGSGDTPSGGDAPPELPPEPEPTEIPDPETGHKPPETFPLPHDKKVKPFHKGIIGKIKGQKRGVKKRKPPKQQPPHVKATGVKGAQEATHPVKVAQKTQPVGVKATQTDKPKPPKKRKVKP